jgi:hypothetical protein
MAQRQSGFTRASSLGPISEVIERQGGSIARVLKAVDLPFAVLERHGAISTPGESGARHRGPHFGARLGQIVRVQNLRRSEKWVSEAESVDDAIGRAMHGLNSMLQTSTVLALTR